MIGSGKWTGWTCRRGARPGIVAMVRAASPLGSNPDENPPHAPQDARGAGCGTRQSLQARGTRGTDAGRDQEYGRPGNAGGARRARGRTRRQRHAGGILTHPGVTLPGWARDLSSCCRSRAADRLIQDTHAAQGPGLRIRAPVPGGNLRSPINGPARIPCPCRLQTNLDKSAVADDPANIKDESRRSNSSDGSVIQEVSNDRQ